ncbi:MAG: DUF4292 domain-containing protein [Bacteroidetes bacterium]|nr:DUF4292 domain-containing protein [Bacteroidota bacterium]
MRILLSFLLLILIGCTSTRSTVVEIDDPSDLTIRSVIDQLWEHTPPDSLIAVGDLALKSPLYSGPKVRAEILHRRADSLLMIFRAPVFGFEAARLLVTQDSLFMYDRLRKHIFVADTTHPVFLRILRVQNAMEYLLGYMRPTNPHDLKLLSDPNGIILEDSLMNRSYTIDPTYWRIVHFAQRDHLGSLVEAYYYNDFFQVGDTYFPQQIIYRNLPEQTNIILSYNQILIDPPMKPLGFNLPSDVQRFEYKDFQ